MGWIQKATASIKRRGTEGVCTGDKFGSSSCPPGSKRYNLAVTFKKMAKSHGHAEGSIAIQQDLYGSTYKIPGADLKYMPPMGNPKTLPSQNTATLPQYAGGSVARTRSIRLNKKSENAAKASEEAKARAGQVEQQKSQLLNPPGMYDRKINTLNFKSAKYADRSEGLANRGARLAIKADKKEMGAARKEAMPSAKRNDIYNAGKQPQAKVDPTTLNPDGTVKATPPPAKTATTETGGKKQIKLASKKGITTVNYGGGQGVSMERGGETFDLPDNAVRGRNTQDLADTGIPRIFAQNIKLRKGKIKRLTFGSDTEATNTLDQQAAIQQAQTTAGPDNTGGTAPDVDQTIQPDPNAPTGNQQQPDPNASNVNTQQQNAPPIKFLESYANALPDDRKKKEYLELLNYLTNFTEAGNTLGQIEKDWLVKHQTPKSMYDSPYYDLIEKSASKYHVQPALIYSMMANESAFNPYAISPSGAIGLMQLMPTTAKELGVTDIFDPAQNIDAGTNYIAQMLGKTKNAGDITGALAMYNWGPGNYQKHLESPTAYPLPEETKKYTDNVYKMYMSGSASVMNGQPFVGSPKVPGYKNGSIAKLRLKTK